MTVTENKLGVVGIGSEEMMLELSSVLRPAEMDKVQCVELNMNLNEMTEDVRQLLFVGNDNCDASTLDALSEKLKSSNLYSASIGLVCKHSDESDESGLERLFREQGLRVWTISEKNYGWSSKELKTVEMIGMLARTICDEGVMSVHADDISDIERAECLCADSMQDLSQMVASDEGLKKKLQEAKSVVLVIGMGDEDGLGDLEVVADTFGGMVANNVNVTLATDIHEIYNHSKKAMVLMA